MFNEMLHSASPSLINPRIKKTYITAPIIAIGCVFLVGFVIATAVVLSLIPLYLPRKDISLWTSPTYVLTLDFPGSLGNDGSLDSAARDAFARKIEESLGLSEGAVTVISATVATDQTGRKRRGVPISRFHRGTTNQGVQRIHIRFKFGEAKCKVQCRKTSFVTKLSANSLTVTFTYNGVRFELTFTISVRSITDNSIPSTLAPTTETTTITTTTESTTSESTSVSTISTVSTTTISTTSTTTTISSTPIVG
ncbi:unnamed protein product [Rotaria sp. Silwood1]|nr:unnamed protein product [Rotaria sp. Silwood1]CAF4925071.1 unnamed protein product [Rotaria sp. Silwood1]